MLPVSVFFLLSHADFECKVQRDTIEKKAVMFCSNKGPPVEPFYLHSNWSTLGAKLNEFVDFCAHHDRIHIRISLRAKHC